ncbi:hypothetical protein FRC10_007680 [Ceratobasidium sp. 414]|nr:hypothetical protein FRC10_007680 [Ceratobasidium sp. 414]
MDLADNEAGAALDHAAQKGQGTDKQISTTRARPPRNGEEATKGRTTRVPESVFEDVGTRRVIRNAIISGKIDEAIELITHHLPTFLPATIPDSGAPSPASNPQPGSHDPSQTKSSLSSSIPPESPSSRAATPIEPTPEPAQLSEKAAQKVDAPTADTTQTGSPKHADTREAPAPDGAPQRNTSSSLGRSVNPVHIFLNLRVQQFLEAVRTVPLEPGTHEENQNAFACGKGECEETDLDVNMHAPDSPRTRRDSETPLKSSVARAPSIPGETRSVARQRHLFESAAQLYQSAQGLKCPSDREIYAKEIEQVCSLMIGPVPEESLAAPYLSMARREALADQVNSSMLHYVGESPAPALQIWAQATKVVWDQIISAHIALPRAADIPADARMYARYVLRGMEGDEERAQAIAVPFDFPALARA